MRLANVNDVRAAPSVGLIGSCPVCGGPVIAKCGTQRVHHWAHRGERHCDRWWEPETEWHRNWKLLFPAEWQEFLMRAPTGEKHIADVRTAQGLTIEFQHSYLPPEERAAREMFYGDMVWVVDGRRLQRDLPRFKDGARNMRRVVTQGVFIHPFPNELLPSSWLKGKAPVFFDFGSALESDASQDGVGRSLWCLLPQLGQDAIVLKVSREALVRLAHGMSKTLLFRHIQAEVNLWLDAERKRQVQEHLRYRSRTRQKAAVSQKREPKWVRTRKRYPKTWR